MVLTFNYLGRFQCLKGVAVVTLLLSCSSPQKKTLQKSDYTAGKFNYYFYEQTGDNQFIKLKGKEVKIKFNREFSKKEALKDLYDLQWTVLYPNSKGKIKLYGFYSQKTGDFILNHWQLSSPFQSQILSYADGIPQVVATITKDSLEPNNFEGMIEFDPKKYNRAIYELNDPFKEE